MPHIHLQWLPLAHVGGQLQAQFMARMRGRDLGRCLVVPVDVGKSMAMALVADHYGEILIAPFGFDLTETGFAQVAAAIERRRCARRRSFGSGWSRPVIITGRWWPG
jgi:hypothetical protein